MRVAIVGGGPACALRLANRGSAIEVQLIERTLRHDFAPSFLWLLTGQPAPERASRSLAPLRRAGVELTEADPAVRMRAPARHLHSARSSLNDAGWRNCDADHTTGNCGGAEAPTPKHR